MAAQSHPSRWARFKHSTAAPVILVMLADFGFVNMDATVSLLEIRGVPRGQVFSLRMWINAILCLSYYLVRDPDALRPLVQPDAWLVWIRSFNNSTNLGTLYVALSLVPLAEVITIQHLRPFLVAALGWIYLREKVTRVQLLACALSFAAVILVVHPTTSDAPTSSDDTADQGGGVRDIGRIVGLGFAAANLLTSAWDLLLCRKLGQTFDPVQLLFAYSVAGSVLGPLWTILSGDNLRLELSPTSWLMVLFVTLCGILGQVCQVMALQLETTLVVAILGYLQIVYSSVWQTLVFSQPLGLIQIVGMAIIIFAGSWSVLYGAPVVEEDEKVEEGQVPLLSMSRPNLEGGVDPPLTELENTIGDMSDGHTERLWSGKKR